MVVERNCFWVAEPRSQSALDSNIVHWCSVNLAELRNRLLLALLEWKKTGACRSVVLGLYCCNSCRSIVKKCADSSH